MLITPYLPKEAEAVARAHMRTEKMPAFVVAIERTPGGLNCQNCNGIGGVFVRICKKGPYQSPRSTSTVYTWFDGNDQFRKGWYIVDETLAYTCPECNGVAREPGPNITTRRIEELKATEDRLARKLKKGE